MSGGTGVVRSYGIVLPLLAWLAAARVTAADLHTLPSNDPDLVVDPGVGLWAWPVPCDADGDDDFDLVVSCRDKPSNGVWPFENDAAGTRGDPLPILAPARRLSATVHYVTPSYVDGRVCVLAPGVEYLDFPTVGIARPERLPVPTGWYVPRGTQPKGPKVRHNQWRLVDHDGDGRLDLVCGIPDVLGGAEDGRSYLPRNPRRDSAPQP